MFVGFLATGYEGKVMTDEESKETAIGGEEGGGDLG